MSTNFNKKGGGFIKIPDYYKYFTWYDLNSVVDIYNFMQEMIISGIDLNDYIELKVYYEIICKNAIIEEPNIETLEYAVKKLKRLLIQYGFAHNVKGSKGTYYYYWYERK